MYAKKNKTLLCIYYFGYAGTCCMLEMMSVECSINCSYTGLSMY